MQQVEAALCWIGFSCGGFSGCELFRLQCSASVAGPLGSRRSSVVGAPGFSCSTAQGIFLDERWNPLFPALAGRFLSTVCHRGSPMAGIASKDKFNSKCGRAVQVTGPPGPESAAGLRGVGLWSYCSAGGRDGQCVQDEAHLLTSPDLSQSGAQGLF